MFLESTAFAILLFVVAMIVWIDLALQIKRWHDRTRSARWVMVCMVPGFGFLWSLIECGLFPGAAGPNRFGKAENTPRRSALLA